MDKNLMEPLTNKILPRDMEAWEPRIFSKIFPWIFFITLILLLTFVILYASLAHASIALPGEDISSKMESAGTLLRFIDTALFKWTARILSGVCMFGTAWCFKEQRIGTGVIVLIAALLFGTSTLWVKNIFSAAGGDSVFSQNTITMEHTTHA